MRKISGFRKLRAGDTIGVIASSSPSEKGRFERSIATLEQFGFRTRVVLDPCLYYGRTDYLFSSESAKSRASALHQLFKDSEVKAILAVRGAYGSMELLRLLNWSRIARYPKPLIGFSDTSALLNPLVSKSGMIAIHGPALESGFGKAPESSEARRSVEALIALLKEGDLSFVEALELEPLTSRRNAEGRLVGGNLSMVMALMGTAWEIDFKNTVLFLEEVGERPYRVHRMLLQLKLAGAFETVKAVLLGSFSSCEHPQGSGATLDQVFSDIFKDCRIPVLRGLPSGHEPLNLPLLLGAKLQIKRNKLEFLEKSRVLLEA